MKQMNCVVEGNLFMNWVSHNVRDPHHFHHSVNSSLKNETAGSSDEICVPVMDDVDDYTVDDEPYHSTMKVYRS